MSSSRPVAPHTVSDEIPPVPLTIEGYCVLHQMMRIRWAAWRQLPSAEKIAVVDEASDVLAKLETNAEGQSALFSLLGQKEAMHPRLFPELPKHRYVCFYPMDRRRGEGKNWYTLTIEERARQMNEHGLVGRRYAGEVRQIITGSIGFDDWEWGVDLFADDPAVFKKLIYEMRFDEVSAAYALFGTFYVGIRYHASDLRML